MKKLLALALGAVTAIAFGSTFAQSIDTGVEGSNSNNALCNDSGALTEGRFLSDLCWSCMMPIRLAGLTGGGRKFPSDTASPVCVCPSKSLMGVPTPGMTAGMWKPTHFVESVRSPGCFATLGQKANLGGIQGLKMGGSQKETLRDMGFRSTHVYTFPVGMVLDMLTSSACTDGSGGGMDMLYISEIDPTYSDPELSMVVNPEASLFSSVKTEAACMADAVASSTYKPIQSLMYCMGSWGRTYPLGGYSAGQSQVRDISLLGARTLAIQHKRGLMKKTYGNSAVCADKTELRYPKHQYRWQILFPMPQRSSNDWTGASTLLTREWRTLPFMGDDYVQILSSYNECCINWP